MTVQKFRVIIINRFTLAQIATMGPFDTETEASTEGQRATAGDWNMRAKVEPVWVTQ